MTELDKLFAKLEMIKDAMSLPDHRKLKNGTYHYPKEKVVKGEGCDWLVTTPDVASIFETGSVGFAPAPVELKSFRQWNREQMEKKTRTLPA